MLKKIREYLIKFELFTEDRMSVRGGTCILNFVGELTNRSGCQVEGIWESASAKRTLDHKMTKEDDDGTVNDVAYGDIEWIAKDAEGERKSLQDEVEELRKRVRQMEHEMSTMKRERLVWAKQRSILVENLGSVLQTAQVEVGRKDKEISKLL